MKFTIKLLVPVMVLALAGLVQAADKKAPEKTPDKGSTDSSSTTVTGMIVTVNHGDITVMIGEKSNQKATVHTDNNTKITVDGKTADLKALHGGMHVTMKGANGVATEIDATAPKNTTKKKA